MTFIRFALLFFISMVVAMPAGHADKPAGLSFGGFKLSPSLSLSATYDDNIYTEKARQRSDLITRIRPELTISRGDKTRSIVFNASADQFLYRRDSDDNYLNYAAALKGHYAFTNKTSWDGFADYRRLHARRGDNLANPDADADSPLAYDVMRAHTRLIHTAGALQWRPYLGITRFEYQSGRRLNGAPINQEARDRNEYKIGGQIRYAVQKGFKLVLEGHLMPRRYDENGADARHSHGGDYLAGLHYQPSKTLWTEIMVGYLHRDYTRPLYDDIDALGLRAGVNWAYSGENMLRLRLNRSIGEITDAGAGGAARTDLSARLSHRLTPTLEGTLGARYRHADYHGGRGADNGRSDRTDHFYALSAGLRYSLSDQVMFTTDYAFTGIESNRDSADYRSNILTTGLQFQF